MTQKVTPNKDIPENTITSVVCLNLTESKMYIYSQKGLLYNRYCFKKYVEQYGEIYSTSSNGHHFVLKMTSAHMKECNAN